MELKKVSFDLLIQHSEENFFTCVLRFIRKWADVPVDVRSVRARIRWNILANVFDALESESASEILHAVYDSEASKKTQSRWLLGRVSVRSWHMFRYSSLVRIHGQRPVSIQTFYLMSTIQWCVGTSVLRSSVCINLCRFKWDSVLPSATISFVFHVLLFSMSYVYPNVRSIQTLTTTERGFSCGHEVALMLALDPIWPMWSSNR